jgi:hypothetical protein
MGSADVDDNNDLETSNTVTSLSKIALPLFKKYNVTSKTTGNITKLKTQKVFSHNRDAFMITSTHQLCFLSFKDKVSNTVFKDTVSYTK